MIGNRLNIFLMMICITLLLFVGCKGNKAGQAETDPRTSALLYLSQNHLDEAEAAFLKAIKLSPDNLSNYIDLTQLYLLQKNYAAAENEAISGLKINADDTDLSLLLAEVYEKKGDQDAASQILKKMLLRDPKNVRAYYMLAEQNASAKNQTVRKQYLLKVSELVPANIVPRLYLAELFASGNNADSARFFLEMVKKITPDFSTAAATSYQQAIAQLQANSPDKALPYIQQFHQLMKITPVYDSGKDEIQIPEMVAGYTGFVIGEDQQTAQATDEKSVLKNLTFTNATERVGLAQEKTQNATHSVLALADREANGDLFVYVGSSQDGATPPKYNLWISKIGGFEHCTVIGGLEHEGKDLEAAFADYDNDGYQDLFVVTTKGTLVFKNQGDGTFAKVTGDIGLNKAIGNKVLFADFDQDGDLDMYLADKDGNKFFRNNGDGTFTENASAMGLTGSLHGISGMSFGDWDGDGDVDIVTSSASGIELLSNNRHSRFTDVTSAAGLKSREYNGTAIAFGDYNNDGRLDIMIAGGSPNKISLLKNTGDAYEPDAASKSLSDLVKGININDAAFIDFDNDGYLDLIIAGVNSNSSASGLKLFHNNEGKGFSDMSNLLPAQDLQAHHIKIGDFDLDGDEDIFLSGPSGAQLLRNDGGNANHYIQVQLTGLAYGNSKNNRQGIGAQVELKAGDLYQLKTVTGPLTEFGVGSRTKLDAVRVIWPNGVPQVIVDPSRKNRILEAEKLKGSCPFLFTWNGTQYEFVKDMLWRSALGMPLAIHGRDTSYAFSDASKEYLLIPGEKLKPREGKYSIKITEELWEAVFLDKAALVAVDHPDSINVYADERFVPPPFPGKNVYRVADQQLPVSADDGKGTNLLPALTNYDFKYVSNFNLGKFQGIAEDHDLILDLGKKAITDNLHLFLRGWIFPPDASINFELTQTKDYQIHPPCLQVINKKGQWQTVIDNLGYPMGRDKMVVVNLSGKFLTKTDRRIRIKTNMQIYWDQAFFSTGDTKSPVLMQDLKMTDASLAYRGYSATYRKGGPYGPEWFDYDNVTKGQKWRDLTGFYTRYGDVLPLLQKADDKYIIADGGDEVSISFDATHLKPLPSGWKRDFLIYSEGWVKDGDLNTANGQTVAPLPYHDMPRYPYGKGFGYPRDKSHREYQETYNTRKVTTLDFTDALRKSKK
ncbi:MAG TPA: FG-GAP-like repeat-containing protein [Mucilaginibacter sp.]|nr:FG-GAP-like repeat-containing protein [Mucilaginibacter sp.]